jgi:hypothetical protein
MGTNPVGANLVFARFSLPAAPHLSQKRANTRFAPTIQTLKGQVHEIFADAKTKPEATAFKGEVRRGMGDPALPLKGREFLLRMVSINQETRWLGGARLASELC